MMRSWLVSLLGLSLIATLEAAPVSYQGELRQAGQVFSGQVNLEFRLFDSVVSGSQIGSTLVRADWTVTTGYFQTELDFGPEAFDGSPRFLEVRVNGSTLHPRRPVTATPQALVANTTISGAIGTSQINSEQVQQRITGFCAEGQFIQKVNQDGSVLCGAGLESDQSTISAEQNRQGPEAGVAVVTAFNKGRVPQSSEQSEQSTVCGRDLSEEYKDLKSKVANLQEVLSALEQEIQEAQTALRSDRIPVIAQAEK